MIRTMPGTFGALYKVGAAYDATGITSPVYLANAAYVKLQNITLSYTLPKVWTKQIYFDEVKVFFSGENLHTWDHLPEGLESDMLSKGAWEYPFMKKFSLGFNVTF